MEPIVIQNLPPSKSYANRLFVMAHLAGVLPFVKKKFFTQWQKEQIPDDIHLMLSALENIPQKRNNSSTFSGKSIIDVGAAGTVLRFVVAVAALTTERSVFLTGTQRLRQRPLLPLLNTLTNLGATISETWGDSTGKQSYLEILPALHPLKGGEVSKDLGKQSSQFVTALLLIAPYLSSPLFVPLPPEAPSKPYIAMTLSMMRKAGAVFSLEKEGVYLQNKPYNPQAIVAMSEQIEGDWSAASYIYGWRAMLPIERDIFIPHLSPLDEQGDKRVETLMLPLGVKTLYKEGEGILLLKEDIPLSPLYNPILKDYPDLLPALFVTSLMRGQPFYFDAIGGVRLKESDRLSALSEVGSSLGFHIKESESSVAWSGEQTLPKELPLVPTLQDHRLPMAWSIAMLRGYPLIFDDSSVVGKSYPLFWRDAMLVGVCLSKR
ncbi:hypothetical protein [Porphyromonas circumdentaria]|nr:hypothetical protein [Porphyromonas circumdentaria]MBB6275151.1 3-phosphoshikimate 1-carboxyvinyltransferase [Porphyromonas circumdentaria]